MNQDNLIEVRDLSVEFVTGEQHQRVVENISFDIRRGETLALVGESGSGKSVTAHSILRLLPYPLARHPSGTIGYAGQDLLTMKEKPLRQIRGNRIAMIFQEPMTSLNPLHSIEKQINEVLGLHKGLTGKAATLRTLELLKLVGIPEPHKRLKALPHELSGGQRQRVGQQAQDRVGGHRLAGAAFADQGQGFTAADIEADIFHHALMLLAGDELDAEVADFDQIVLIHLISSGRRHRERTRR